LIKHQDAEPADLTKYPLPRKPGTVYAMNRIHVALVAVLLFWNVSWARPAGPPLLMTGGHILDPEGHQWIDGSAILARDGRIESIGPGVAAPADAKVLDLKGLYIIPGLMDLHTHLLLHPYDETSWNDQVLKESLELRTIRATAAAKATLLAGFTTIRELGTEGAGFADVALREATGGNGLGPPVHAIIPGPRIFTATRALVATGSYGPAGFDPRWTVPKGAQEADGPDGLRKAVRGQIAAGADWVKLYADYRRFPASPTTPTFAEDELKAAVDEARSAGKPVAAHATTDEGIRRAVLAGVNTIEHGYGASRDTLLLMKERGTVLCPTMAAAEAVARYAGWREDQPPPEGVRKSRESFRMALDEGIIIACGSDAGVFAHGTNWKELELMTRNGMSPGQALASATSVAAGVLGRRADLGRIATGFAADLVAVSGDPMREIGALRSVRLVVCRGEVVAEIK
jgi:imidazolonepropionase-like amidohydrolase